MIFIIVLVLIEFSLQSKPLFNKKTRFGFSSAVFADYFKQQKANKVLFSFIDSETWKKSAFLNREKFAGVVPDCKEEYLDKIFYMTKSPASIKFQKNDEWKELKVYKQGLYSKTEQNGERVKVTGMIVKIKEVPQYFFAIKAPTTDYHYYQSSRVFDTEIKDYDEKVILSPLIPAISTFRIVEES